MLLANRADHHVSPLQSIFSTENHMLGFPERLRLDKVDSVFCFVAFALLQIKLEYHAVDLIRAAESSSTDCGFCAAFWLESLAVASRPLQPDLALPD
jgi:hypothetical protein